MAIRPISMVTNNYVQPAFEGKKKEKTHHKNYVSNTLMAVPLATLLAMSPLTKAEAQNLPKVISIEFPFGNPNEKVLFKKTFPDAYDFINGSSKIDNDAITFLAISNDGDDSDFEIGKLELTQSGIKLNRKDEKTGKNIQVIAKNTYSYTIKKLREVEVVSPVASYSDFYVVGPEVIKTEYKLPNGNTREEYTYNDDKDRLLPVSEEFFDAVSDIMGNKVEYENTSDPDNDVFGLFLD